MENATEHLWFSEPVGNIIATHVFKMFQIICFVTNVLSTQKYSGDENTLFIGRNSFETKNLGKYSYGHRRQIYF